ncbi:MAG: glycosyltransferase family 4 protein [Acidimicrobiia bacterium]|nr:glycosyltransferase family 4 protein [Acidimicrobiia bacterium]MDH4362702.1 glycosyltransferase family 4 protein [Acidimicrobiia bacterium]
MGRYERPLTWLMLASHVPADGARGGMIRYAVEATRALNRRDDVRVLVHCTPAARPLFVDQLGIPADQIVAEARGSVVVDSLIELGGLSSTLRRHKVDVVHGTKHLVPLRGQGALRMLTVHDTILFDRPQEYGAVKRMALPAAYRASLRRAEVLACVSRATLGRLALRLPGPAASGRVVPLAMASSLLEASSRPVPALDGRAFALVVGDLSPRKNVGYLLGLWPDVRRRVPDAHLAIVGPPGWGRQGPLPMLDELQADGAVSMLGRISDGQLRWAYQNARVALCPSLLEGFGLPAMEATAFGCPTVLSEDPAMQEAAGGRGRVIGLDRPGEWVESIVERLGSAALRPARGAVRSWDDVAAELVGLARSAIGARGPEFGNTGAGPAGTSGGLGQRS